MTREHRVFEYIRILLFLSLGFLTCYYLDKRTCHSLTLDGGGLYQKYVLMGVRYDDTGSIRLVLDLVYFAHRPEPLPPFLFSPLHLSFLVWYFPVAVPRL